MKLRRLLGAALGLRPACIPLACLLLAPAALADTLPGRGLAFDGKDDQVRVPLSDSLNDPTEVSLEAWVFADSTDAGGIAGMWGKGGLPDRFLLDFTAGQIFARVGLPTGTFEVAAPAPLATWFHVALTHDGVELRLFLDGALVGSTPAVGKIGNIFDDFVMGMEDITLGGIAQHFEGRLDEVRVWKNARSNFDIARLHNQRVATDSDGLIGQWSFQEAVGDQTCRDSSLAGNHGTLGRDAMVASDDPLRVPSDAPLRWDDLGFALAGVSGKPLFQTRGSLVAPDPVDFKLSNAAPLSRAVLVVGLTTAFVPFSGGTMVPSPDQFYWSRTDAAGEIFFSVNWPPAVPPCTNLYLQWWVRDPAAPKGWSASNAMRLETP